MSQSLAFLPNPATATIMRLSALPVVPRGGVLWQHYMLDSDPDIFCVGTLYLHVITVTFSPTQAIGTPSGVDQTRPPSRLCHNQDQFPTGPGTSNGCLARSSNQSVKRVALPRQRLRVSYVGQFHNKPHPYQR
jgi:hypothetical protein